MVRVLATAEIELRGGRAVPVPPRPTHRFATVLLVEVPGGARLPPVVAARRKSGIPRCRHARIAVPGGPETLAGSRLPPTAT